MYIGSFLNPFSTKCWYYRTASYNLFYSSSRFKIDLTYNGQIYEDMNIYDRIVEKGSLLPIPSTEGDIKEENQKINDRRQSFYCFLYAKLVYAFSIEHVRYIRSSLLHIFANLYMFNAKVKISKNARSICFTFARMSTRWP